MSIELKIFILLVLLVLLFSIVQTAKGKKMSMKYCSFWILLIMIMLVIVMFPNIVINLASICGFEVSSNMIFLLGFLFLFYLIFILTISISIQNNKIKLLVQEVSLLKEKVKKNGK